jgi:TRAP transporter 4TM/12TM fusion protein
MTDEPVLKGDSTKVDYNPGRFNQLPPYLKAFFVFLTVIGVATATIYMTNTTVFGYALPTSVYYYILFMMFLPVALLTMPATKHVRDQKGLPWYDYLLILTALAIPIYFIRWNFEIVWVGWTPAPTTTALIVAIVYGLIILEACRRMAGWVFFAICVVFALYPLVAEKMPGVFYGIGYSPREIISYAIYGGEGLIGMPGQITGGTLIGFLIFAGALIASGAGAFFLDLSSALLGRYRGGPAKVAVLSSGFFGSLSGSPISNIISTGSITIPAMKRIGYSPRYAAALETCASSGGALMPPVMGLTVFVMVVIAQISYAEIMVAALFPSLLYYGILVIQADFHAARMGLNRLPDDQIPSFRQTMKEGWQFILVLAFLVWGLLYMRWAEITPYYASALLFVLSFFNRKTMMTPRRLVGAFIVIGNLISQMMALIMPFTFILVGLVITGTSASFAAGLVNLGGGNIYLILALGLVACYILGIVGFSVAAYIFLAISMAPALEQLGLNKMAVHLFLVYYTNLSILTPPIAIGAFVAAAMAGASPMKTAWTAMKLGVVIYFIPIFFVLQPALILQGTWGQALVYMGTGLIGTIILAGGLSGYLWFAGPIKGFWKRLLLFVGGLILAAPFTESGIIGAIMVTVVLGYHFLTRHREAATAA